MLLWCTSTQLGLCVCSAAAQAACHPVYDVLLACLACTQCAATLAHLLAADSLPPLVCATVMPACPPARLPDRLTANFPGHLACLPTFLQVHVLLAVEVEGSQPPLFNIYRPATGRSRQNMGLQVG